MSSLRRSRKPKTGAARPSPPSPIFHQISFPLWHREYILGEVGKLAGGISAVNSNVMGALREWLTTEAKALLERMPNEERGTSDLMYNVASMLSHGVRLAEAEELMRQMLAVHRAQSGERSENTLAAKHRVSVTLGDQGKHAEAEALLREVSEVRREVLGDNHEDTQRSIGRLGEVLLEQGKLDEAEPCCVEAAKWFRQHKGRQDIGSVARVGVLVELRRMQGRLAEAEQELGSLVSDARRGLGPQHVATLEAEAIAARLKHAQPNGQASGAAELRAVVEKMGEFLGATHHDTVKWQGVLEEVENGRPSLAKRWSRGCSFDEVDLLC